MAASTRTSLARVLCPVASLRHHKPRLTMNYILALKLLNASQTRELQALRAGLDNLKSYLSAPKFRCGDRLDGYVNIADVLDRLRSAESDALTAREHD